MRNMAHFNLILASFDRYFKVMNRFFGVRVKTYVDGFEI